MLGLITVSNGAEFIRIDPNDAPAAAADGFYRPLERGLTIVGNGQHLFEIPLSDVEAAKQNGYSDLLDAERNPMPTAAPQRLVHRAAAPMATAGAVDIEADDIEADEDDLLIDGLSQAEQEEEEARLAREQELEKAEGLDWYKVFMRQWLEARRAYLERQMGSHGISIAIHVAIFLLLASLVMVDDNTEKGILLSAAPASPESVQEVVIETEQLEITDPTEVEESEAPPETTEVEVTTEAVSMDFMASVSGAAATSPVVSKDPGNGKSTPSKPSSVFGTQATANDYVFVIDNSNSMTFGRFETALHELVLAINNLTKKQRFYVIFYSDTAYGMMYPNPVTQLVYATPRNKQQLFHWLNSVPMCLKTNGKEAIQAAFDMKPDVIYVLGDGAFTDNAGKYFASQPKTKTVLHTRGMQVSSSLAKTFAALAKKHGGNYKDVGVLPAAAALAKRNPRPRLKTRTGPWGLELQAKQKKKK